MSIFEYESFVGEPPYSAECIVVLDPPDNSVLDDINSLETEGVDVAKYCGDSFPAVDTILVILGGVYAAAKTTEAVAKSLREVLKFVRDADQAYAEHQERKAKSGRKTKVNVYLRKRNPALVRIIKEYPSLDIEAHEPDEGDDQAAAEDSQKAEE